MTVWNMSMPARKSATLIPKVFASQDVAEAWFKENDPEGVAFEYEVLE
ncbi:hypothetical protein [Bradyrhizobium icense]|nr:hypothetical protein [Bradyrhizobium icense]